MKLSKVKTIINLERKFRKTFENFLLRITLTFHIPHFTYISYYILHMHTVLLITVLLITEKFHLTMPKSQILMLGTSKAAVKK